MLPMRWLRKAIKDPFEFILKLPFYLIYLFFRWLFSKDTSNGYVVSRSEMGKLHFEHRDIAEKILGRKLKSWEVVHHINGKRNDNRPSNLCVMDSHEHDRYHKWYDWIYKTYGRYPRRETQLKKLRGTFRGTILIDSNRAKNRVG